jgi:hypothetical protein
LQEVAAVVAQEVEVLAEVEFILEVDIQWCKEQHSQLELAAAVVVVVEMVEQDKMEAVQL